MLAVSPDFKLGERIRTYFETWQLLIDEAKLSGNMLQWRPTTLSLKVADKAALYKLLIDNAAQIEQVHIGTVNERYIASAVLARSYKDLSILKILERRPGSDDPLGLDSIDFLVANLEEAFQALQTAGLPVIKEHNDVHGWLSLRFGKDDQFEAKFTDHLVLEVAIKELELSIEKLL